MSVINTLQERISSYEELTNYKLIKKLPVITILNGRSFKKNTSLLEKPFSSQFIELMCATIIKLAQEIDGISFIYSFNDEIVIVSRNDRHLDTNAWCDNNIQKMVSLSASVATLEFNKIAKNNIVELLGDPIFTSKTFVVPNIVEAINTLISKQQQCFYTSLHMACFYELLKKYDIETVKQTLLEKNAAAKAEILFEECGIEYNKYPLSFKRGIACYRIPKVINGEEIKNKLTIDMEIPIFTKDHNFLSTIFKNGHYIFKGK